MTTVIDPRTIAELAAAPSQAKNDEGYVNERAISELLEADRYLRAQAVGEQPPWGLRMARTTPRGTVT